MTLIYDTLETKEGMDGAGGKNNPETTPEHRTVLQQTRVMYVHVNNRRPPTTHATKTRSKNAPAQVHEQTQQNEANCRPLQDALVHMAGHEGMLTYVNALARVCITIPQTLKGTQN